jgi:hypothetical protein
MNFQVFSFTKYKFQQKCNTFSNGGNLFLDLEDSLIEDCEDKEKTKTTSHYIDIDLPH